MDLFVAAEEALLTFPGTDEIPLSDREKGIEWSMHTGLQLTKIYLN